MSQAIPIASFPTRTEAEVVVGLLESEGIEAWISADDAGGAYPFSLSGGAQVLVDESDAQAAREVLARSTET
jgi:Putative prokaryotic signal transducing protein